MRSWDEVMLHSGKEKNVEVQIDGSPHKMLVGPSFLTYAMEGRSDYESSVIPVALAAEARAYLLCVPISNKAGNPGWDLREARTRYAPTIKNRRRPLPSGGLPPLFLVGLLGELRTQATRTASLRELEAKKSWSQGEPLVVLARDDLEQLANEIGAVAYKEVSAATGEGVLDLLEATAHEIKACASAASHPAANPPSQPTAAVRVHAKTTKPTVPARPVIGSRGPRGPSDEKR